MNHFKPIRHALCLAALLIASPFIQALPSDQDQPIHISSDRAERDTKKGITIYSGSVKMDQGSLSIRANRIIIHSDSDNKVSKIVAKGKPAHYQQVPEINKPLVIAKGSTIEYNIASEQLQLIESASLQQSDGTTMTGNNILYDIKAAVVKAQGNTESSGERIHMVIPPKNQRQ